MRLRRFSRRRTQHRRAGSANSARAQPAIMFVVGLLLSFPGASCTAGMHELSKHHIGTVATIAAVIAFSMIMLILLELRLVAYAIWPQSTEAGVQRFSGG